MDREYKESTFKPVVPSPQTHIIKSINEPGNKCDQNIGNAVAVRRSEQQTGEYN